MFFRNIGLGSLSLIRGYSSQVRPQLEKIMEEYERGKCNRSEAITKLSIAMLKSSDTRNYVDFSVHYLTTNPDTNLRSFMSTLFKNPEAKDAYQVALRCLNLKK